MILGLTISWIKLVLIVFFALFPLILFFVGLQSVIDWFNQADWDDVWIGFLRVVFVSLMFFGVFGLIFL